jgi:hypothetical protein
LIFAARLIEHRAHAIGGKQFGRIRRHRTAHQRVQILDARRNYRRAPILLPGEVTHQTQTVREAKCLANARPAHIAIDQQHALIKLRKRNREIDGDGGLAFGRPRARYQQRARRLVRA